MKIKRALYDKALAEVLDVFGVDKDELFQSNRDVCREGRIVLFVVLRPYLSCNDIAELCSMWRSSICAVMNKYDRAALSWSAQVCLDKLKKRLDVLEKELREQ